MTTTASCQPSAFAGPILLDRLAWLALAGMIRGTAWLGPIYSRRFTQTLPRDFGAVLLARLGRGFATHANTDNPYARRLLTGHALPSLSPPRLPADRSVSVLLADVADFLEQGPANQFDGFALSNVLDGAGPGYGDRLWRAVDHAAASGAVAVLRSFGEPRDDAERAEATKDRALLWGRVEVWQYQGETRHA